MVGKGFQGRYVVGVQQATGEQKQRENGCVQMSECRDSMRKIKKGETLEEIQEGCGK